MPENTVYVGRGSKWGNPYEVKEYGREEAVNRYKQMVLHRYKQMVLQKYKDGTLDVTELKGKSLACWCKKGVLCHGDFLLSFVDKIGTIGDSCSDV